MAAPDLAGSGLEVSQATDGNADTNKQLSPPTAPTTDLAPTAIEGQGLENAPPLSSEKTANPAPETSGKPVPEIPKSRPISKDQIGLKILYPPEDLKKAPKIEVE
jgi:hypothetical protein